ncbi:MAG: type VI-B CRISPR-associated RNA-guided ribonuclease Cas13b [Thermoguttaceae bacterium]|nr:type VI-B CRISPR-associated RNA-guided ribonuclease Cas13b [Thermoguttaceae bacterium]
MVSRSSLRPKLLIVGYSKCLLDGSTLEDRRLCKRIKTFCRIQEAEQLYCEERKKMDSLYWIPTADEAPPKSYRLDMRPQYMIKNNQIGFRMVKKDKSFPPRLQGRRTRNTKPQYWLSLNELPFLTFLVTQNRINQVQNCISKYEKNWKALLQKVLDGKPVTWSSEEQFVQEYNIRSRDIPDELLYYFKHGHVKAFRTQLRTICIDELIAIAEKKLASLKNIQYDRKIGRDRISIDPAGRVALRVIRELVQFQPSNTTKPHQGKVTSPNFNLLYACLAMYNEYKGTLNTYKDNLYDLFMRAGLLDNPAWPHPFLGKILKKDAPPCSLVAFYKQYLEHKIKYLKACKDQTNTDMPVHFLRQYDKRAKRKADPDNYILAFARTLYEEPVNLPRGLFEAEVREVINKKFSDQFQEECPEDVELSATSRPKYNSTWLIGKFLEWSGDSPQWFYAQPRNPQCKRFRKLFLFLDRAEIAPGNDNIRALKANLNKKPIGHYPKTGQNGKTETNEDRNCRKKNLQEYDDIEKNIRQTKMKDIILLEIARQLLCSLPQEKLRLGNIRPGQFMLGDSTEMSMTLKVPASCDKKNSDPAVDFTITGKMKIKNYGNMQRMRSDVRLFSFLRTWKQFRNSCNVSYEEMEKELDMYDRERCNIMSRILELENLILEKHPDIPQTEEGYTEFTTILKHASSIPDHKKMLLRIIRNAFLHHRYPEFVLMTPPTLEEMLKSCNLPEDTPPEEKERLEKELKREADNYAMLFEYCKRMKVMPGECKNIESKLPQVETVTEAIVAYVNELFDSVLPTK